MQIGQPPSRLEVARTATPFAEARESNGGDCDPGASRRYHGLDLLRASMMFLGVVLHVAMNYQLSPADAAWPYRDPNQIGLAGILVLGIHAFRMPVFFVMAGFFAGMTRSRLGMIGCIKSRAQRIALPMVVGWILLFPLVKFAFTFGALRSAGTPIHDALGSAAAHAFAHPWDNPTPIHLWFLYYLLIVLVFVLAAAAMASTLPGRARAISRAATASLLHGRWRWARVPVLVLLTWLTLLPMHGPLIDTPGSFVPSARLLACYGVFFVMGWLMFDQCAMIDELRSWSGLRLAAGLVALVLYLGLAIAWFLAIGSGQPASTAAMVVLRVTAVAALSLSAWLLILGGIGLVERLVQRSSRAVRVVVDSSFWVYLVHLPLCVLIPALMRDWDAPGLIKLSAGVLIVLALSLVGYEAFRNVLPRRASR